MKRRLWKPFEDKTEDYTDISRRVFTHILTEGRVSESAYQKLCNSEASRLFISGNVLVVDEQGLVGFESGIAEDAIKRRESAS